MNKDKIDNYMRYAIGISMSSKSNKLKVGCIISDIDDKIIATGKNHMPVGFEEECEDELGNTKSLVIHAEDDALRTLIILNGSTLGASIFITHSPCINCAVRIRDAGIKDVYYKEAYRNTDGLEFLVRHNINVNKVDI